MNKTTTNEFCRLLSVLKGKYCVYCNGKGIFALPSDSKYIKTCRGCEGTGLKDGITSEEIIKQLTSVNE